MKVLKVFVGRPREVAYEGDVVLTSIWKDPIEGPVQVRTLNIDGDQQSDLTVHGGRKKAVYAYPSEHYAAWRHELKQPDLAWGAFGENLTVEGLLEADLRIGDRLRIGSVLFEVTQPRMPCFKLAIRFDRDDMIVRFLRSGRSGFYLSVVTEGTLQSGDAIAHLPVTEPGPTVADVAKMAARRARDL